MNQQFHLLTNSTLLANAASFLESQGVTLRSRNQLINEALRWLDRLAEEIGVKVAEEEATAFLEEKGLCGEKGKAEKLLKAEKTSQGGYSGFVVDPEQLKQAVALSEKKKSEALLRNF